MWDLLLGKAQLYLAYPQHLAYSGGNAPRPLHILLYTSSKGFIQSNLTVVSEEEIRRR